MNDLESKSSTEQNCAVVLQSNCVKRYVVICVCLACFVWASCFLQSIPDDQPKWQASELSILLTMAREFYDSKGGTPLPATLTQKLIESRAQFTLYLFDDPKKLPIQSATVPSGTDPEAALKEAAIDLKRNTIMTRQIGGSGFLKQIAKLKDPLATRKRLYVVLSSHPGPNWDSPKKLIFSPDYLPQTHTLIVRKKRSIAITPVDVVLRQATRKTTLGVLQFSLGFKSDNKTIPTWVYQSEILGEGIRAGTVSSNLPHVLFTSRPRQLGFVSD